MRRAPTIRLHAAVLEARATLDAAKKNYDDTFVRAEVDGRAGRALMDLGADRERAICSPR
jgi:multidrug resistance efflux pump